jgi:hypothetical protein
MFGETVVRLRRTQTGVDRYNNPVYGAPAELSIDGALFAPGGTQEPAEPGRTPVIDVPTLYFRGQWPDVEATDQFRVRGEVYEVTGDPADWRAADTSGAGGLVVQLRKVSG